MTCTNLIQAKNPCFNIYCKNCVIDFIDKKHNFEEETDEFAKKSQGDESERGDVSKNFYQSENPYDSFSKEGSSSNNLIQNTISKISEEKKREQKI